MTNEMNNENVTVEGKIVEEEVIVEKKGLFAKAKETIKKVDVKKVAKTVVIDTALVAGGLAIGYKCGLSKGLKKASEIVVTKVAETVPAIAEQAIETTGEIVVDQVIEGIENII